MKLLLGLLLILVGIALGAYVGVWICFVGGIVEIINTAKAGVWEASEIAWGVAKIVFAGGAGALSAWVFIIPGMGLIMSK